MKKIFNFFFCLFMVITANAQFFDEQIINTKAVDGLLQEISHSTSISADSTLRLLANWDKYPTITKTGADYLFYYKDAFFGEVPVRVFIPASYHHNQKTPLLLSLHGLVGRSSFDRANRFIATHGEGSNFGDEEIFFKYLSTQDFILLRPFADPSKNFDWVVNRMDSTTNPTLLTIVDIIRQLKKFLNIDDSKVYAFGYSDGSDGVFCLDVYQPSLFAGFTCYSSLLTGISERNVYLKNTINRPLYVMHTGLDEIRPIEQAREIVQLMKNIKTPVSYKEYAGYTHYDRQLAKDFPNTIHFFKSVSRNPFPKNMYWEMNDTHNNQCDWIKITAFDITMNKAKWHQPLNVKVYNPSGKDFENEDYYTIDKSAAIKGRYENNLFEIETSCVKAFDILISKNMVNLEKPIQVKVNGKMVFNEKVSIDKSFMIENFKKNFDRQALWVNAIHIKLAGS